MTMMYGPADFGAEQSESPVEAKIQADANQMAYDQSAFSNERLVQIAANSPEPMMRMAASRAIKKRVIAKLLDGGKMGPRVKVKSGSEVVLPYPSNRPNMPTPTLQAKAVYTDRTGVNFGQIVEPGLPPYMVEKLGKVKVNRGGADAYGVTNGSQVSYAETVGPAGPAVDQGSNVRRAIASEGMYVTDPINSGLILTAGSPAKSAKVVGYGDKVKRASQGGRGREANQGGGGKRAITNRAIDPMVPVAEGNRVLIPELVAGGQTAATSSAKQFSAGDQAAPGQFTQKEFTHQLVQNGGMSGIPQLGGVMDMVTQYKKPLMVAAGLGVAYFLYEKYRK